MRLSGRRLTVEEVLPVRVGGIGAAHGLADGQVLFVDVGLRGKVVVVGRLARQVSLVVLRPRNEQNIRQHRSKNL